MSTGSDYSANTYMTVAWRWSLSSSVFMSLAFDTALGPEVIVPGHGPVAGLDAVREQRAYFEYLYEQARAHHAEGLPPLEAARALSMDRWADWGEGERLVVNLANIYSELEGRHSPVDPLAAFQQMAELAQI